MTSNTINMYMYHFRLCLLDFYSTLLEHCEPSPLEQRKSTFFCWRGEIGGEVTLKPNFPLNSVSPQPTLAFDLIIVDSGPWRGRYRKTEKCNAVLHFHLVQQRLYHNINMTSNFFRLIGIEKALIVFVCNFCIYNWLHNVFPMGH